MMTRSARSSLAWSIAGLASAIGITTTMDATGLTVFSALPLFPLMALFSFLQRLRRTEMGMVWGRGWHYALALLYPLVVLGLAVLIAWLAGAIDVSTTDWQRLGTNLVLMSVTGALVLVLTEEGFFRGWLWASLDRARQSEVRILLWTSLAFAAWHWSWAVFDSGLNLQASQVPIYLTNAAAMGAVWGMMRLISGSVIVAAVSHSIWNGIAYTLYGAGPIEGVLGIENKLLFDAEIGLVGLTLNLLFAVALWLWWIRRKLVTAAEVPGSQR